MGKIKKLIVKARLKPINFLATFGFMLIFLSLTAQSYAQQGPKRILIIGAGPSGLVAAKSALECGLEPVVLEQDEVVGGAWKPQKGLMWHSMITNISRYNSMFSDFQWPAATPDFPNNRIVYEYLEDYAAHFDLIKYIHFNSEVLHIKQHHKQWKVTWKEGDKKIKQQFDFVIVATGMFSKPYLPALEGLDEFRGEIIHSKDYKDPALFDNKRVVIVGGMFSGSQIATDLCHNASQITNVINKPGYILDRYLQIPPDSTKLPIDLALNKRGLKEEFETLSIQERNLRDHAFYSKLCKEQGLISKSLAIEANADDPAYVTISETYLSSVQTGDIKVTLNNIDYLDKDGIIFKNGERQNADAIIFCTGYELNLAFLDKTIQKSLSYLQEDRLQPVLLHKNVFHPLLPNMAFVGIYRGTHWGIMELQARWASMIFSGMLEAPSPEAMLEGIDQQLAVRKQKPKPQFPHNGYKCLIEDLAHEMGVVPDLEYFKLHDPQLYHALLGAPIIPAHYRLSGFGKKPDIARQIIEDLHDMLQKRG
jgi:dimethylaniline monooxygenase (N-oxide forming)